RTRRPHQPRGRAAGPSPPPARPGAPEAPRPAGPPPTRSRSPPADAPSSPPSLHAPGYHHRRRRRPHRQRDAARTHDAAIRPPLDPNLDLIRLERRTREERRQRRRKLRPRRRRQLERQLLHAPDPTPLAPRPLQLYRDTHFCAVGRQPVLRTRCFSFVVISPP